MSSYSTLTPGEIESGVDRAIADSEAVVSEIVSVSGERTFENTLRPLDRIADILAHAFTDYAFMGYVHTDRDVRDAAKEAEAKTMKWASDVYFRDDLDEAVRAYASTEEAATLQGEHKRLLEFVLRDLRRAGHELDAETRKRVQELTQREIELGVRFQQNIDEWDDWILVSRDDLEGLPDVYIDGLAVDEETGLYKVSIAYPEMFPFLENSPRRGLREELRFKFNTVAIEENRKLLEEALDIRQEIAEAFDLPTWAHHRLELRMARSPERVKEMYAELKEPLTTAAGDELAAVSRLLEADTGDTRVQQWDWAYYDNQQRKTDFGVDNFEVAQYFPLPQVLEGMFQLTSEMFGITFVEIT
ncbi:MAG TPA: M3 family metallopeptidase, partial [Acidimicrobiia bacterium]